MLHNWRLACFVTNEIGALMYIVTKINYKGKLVGIDYLEVNENYTSKCSVLDLESIEHHDKYVGKRVKRGLFKTAAGKNINADVNGALNILRKVVGDNKFKRLVKTDRGIGQMPVKVDVFKKTQPLKILDKPLGLLGK